MRTMVGRCMRCEHGAVALAVVLYMTPVRRADAESFLDVKVMQYRETDGRVQVFSPAFIYQHEWSPNIGIRIDGVFNSISGASPTGAPPIPVTTLETVTTTVPVAPSSAPATTTTTAPSTPAPAYGGEDGENDNEREGDAARASASLMNVSGPWHAAAAATPVAPASTPAPTTTAPSTSSSGGTSSGGTSSGGTRTVTTTREVPSGEYTVPMADVNDTRIGANVELYGKVGPQHLSGKLSYSTEEDYESIGLAVSDGIELGRSGTTLLLGGAYTHDQIDIFYTGGQDLKTTVDGIIGVRQVLSGQTVLQANLSVGELSGFLGDTYKVVELNGVLVPEQRPDNKQRQIGFLSLTQGVRPLHGTFEASYRYYDDSFDVTAHTLALAWFQKLGQAWLVRPRVRWYDQSAASFYDVSFSGTPEFYSADYRVSALQSISYGLKLVWRPSTRATFDVGYDRYQDEGKDGVTVAEVYPVADVVTLGARLWF